MSASYKHTRSAALNERANRILVGGVNLDRIARRNIPALRRKFGIIFQDYKLIPHKTIHDNVALVLECAGARGRAVTKRVSTVLRYVYYFRGQGRQKFAMQRYAALAGVDGSLCAACDGPCLGRCPHGVDVQCQLLSAHDLPVKR